MFSSKNESKKTVHFLKSANSFILNRGFHEGEVANLPSQVANYFLAKKLAEEVDDAFKPTPILKKDRKKFIQHPLIVENSIEARLYQEVAFAETVKENAIVILPTGLGKTVIAALSSVFWLSKDESNKVIIFAPTRPLLDQHYQTFSNWLNLEADEIVQITGKTYKQKRLKMFEKARMIFMTPQIKLDVFDLQDVALMIFDECHRAVGRYKYVMNAEQYFNEARDPHVLGLTATPGTARQLLKIMKHLKIEKVTLATEDSPSVKPYTHPIYEQYVKITLPTELMELRNFINENLKNKLKVLHDNPLVKKYSEGAYRVSPHKLANIVRQHLQEMGPIRFILMQALSLTYLLNLIEAQSLDALEKKLSGLQGSRNPIYREIKERLLALRMKGMDHPKPEIATRLIKKFCDNHVDSRVLVFVQYLDSLDVVLTHLQQSGLKADKLVGQKTMNQDLQRETLSKFKDGEYQVLVATSVAEEGLDVAQCDLVVFYDCIPSGIRTVQRKGRTGRRRAGRLVYLYTEGTWEESFFWISRKRILDTNEVVGIMERQKNPIKFLEHYLKTKNIIK
jgi:ERCC4-related helicase